MEHSVPHKTPSSNSKALFVIQFYQGILNALFNEYKHTFSPSPTALKHLSPRTQEASYSQLILGTKSIEVLQPFRHGRPQT